ncbi:MAG: histone deacetylase [Desulfobacteraceae bacterium]|nr:histone deacetylase [Desulfobacteraceae bacterium]
MAEPRPITLITHPRFFDHDTGGHGHPEMPGRLTAIAGRLEGGPLAPLVTSTAEIKPAEWHQLTPCHDETYLYRFEEAALAGRSWLDHPDNQLSFGTYEAALLAAGAGIAGIDLLESGTRTVFGAVRPPGHHAEQGTALGFCFLNNVAVAARYWQQQHGRRKIMIIDWDAHHGNGIQAAFEEDPEVFYISLHEHPTFSFPGTGWAEDTGSGAGRGTTLNLPLPPGTGDAIVLALLRGRVASAIERFRPDGLIVAAGFDGAAEDDMSGLSYSPALFRDLGRLTAAWAEQYCQGRVLSLLEGGYHLESLARGVEAYLGGLAGVEV